MLHGELVTLRPATGTDLPALAAIRAYTKVGFRPVGIMRRYWRDPEGVWQDGLLLDLLAEELV